MTDTFVPIFPLNTVLFPDGPLPLRIFEPRYLAMISGCLKEESNFGVVQILSGSETGRASMAPVGTLARITDWYQGSDGILGLTAVGVSRFRLDRVDRQADGLYLGQVEMLAPESRQAVPEDYRSMVTLLEAVIDDLGKLYEDIDKDYDDATWVGCRFAEILPISNDQKQHCLELNDPVERLAFVRPLLRSFRVEKSQ
jgi:Lon protease-like protein